MDTTRRGETAGGTGAPDTAGTGTYGVAWLGLLAAGAGVVIGALMVLSETESSLLGSAVVVLSVGVGAVAYLVSKVLDRL